MGYLRVLPMISGKSIWICISLVINFDYFCIMDKRLERFKGIHPGLILERELKKKDIKPSPFARSLPTHKQIFNAIIKGKRGIPVALALKVDHALGLEEGTFALLQTYYDIERVKRNRPSSRPNLEILRKALFWDTAIESIDWETQYKAVIERVFERGNQDEQNEIKRFYGEEKVSEVLSDYQASPMTLQRQN